MSPTHLAKMAEAFERDLLDATYCDLMIEDDEEDNDENMDVDWDVDSKNIETRSSSSNARSSLSVHMAAVSERFFYQIRPILVRARRMSNSENAWSLCQAA
ncbi:hypothetical protein Y032_0052g2241 [Ancylostoma ceylanicum]|uniref:Uncharacterized protein n=1 Tax=Ancylostoma ceylanicum TaxID=53326 RepID=A0A016U889_9BILA|nr:hypothetical protein Y032_0052g2241 [Ancylostoma ceylanicum]